MKSKLEEILNNVINDFNAKWKSHEEKSDGISKYIDEILALQQPPVSNSVCRRCSSLKDVKLPTIEECNKCGLDY